MWKAAVMLGAIGLAAAAHAAPVPAPETGDRRGRISTRIGERANERATPRTTGHWTDPVARSRTAARPVASTPSDAITYGREYRPR